MGITGLFCQRCCLFSVGTALGEVPITKGTTYFGKIAKSSVHDVLEEATTWALKALELPIYSELVDHNGDSRTTKQYGSKGAAAALLAHLYAWRATIEEKPEYLIEAEKYCTMIIENKAGNYSLVASPEEVCTNVMQRNSNESIWEIHRSVQDQTVSSMNPAYISELFVGIPTFFDMWEGVDKYYNVMIFKETVREMYDPEDRRRDAYFWGLDAEKLYYVDRGGKEMLVLEPLASDYILMEYNVKNRLEAYMNKFRYPIVEVDPLWGWEDYVGMDINKVVWRLADIILLRAECRARQGNPAAAEDLNRIRERAYGNRSHDYSASEGDLQLAVFREREKELIFEDHRYYDVRRNGLDYVRRELPAAFGELSDADIRDGALYLDIDVNAKTENDLMRHNVYWNKFLQ